MQIARAVAGFTLGQADIMRRAMGKKNKDEMARQRILFLEGAKAGGIDGAEAGRIFDLLERFADYGFPKGHAAAYGVLSYQTAYLKAHYPLEFAAALLSVERGDHDKVAQYIGDARHMGIDVLAPDVNASGADFTPDGEVIRFGLYGIKNVGEAAVDHVMAERRAGGPYQDLFDFCRRVDLTVVNKRAVEYLIKAGAFDALAPAPEPGAPATAGRALLLANLDTAMRWGAAWREHEKLGQASLFGEASGQQEPVPELQPGAGDEDLDELTMLRFEKDALGIYISRHPMNSYPGLVESASCSIAQLEQHYRRLAAEQGGRVRAVLAGLIQNVVRRTTRKGDMMARFELADETGSFELVAFSRRFEQIAGDLVEDRPAIVVVELSQDGDAVRAVVEKLLRWDGRERGDGSLPELVQLEFRPADVERAQLLELRSVLDERSGAMALQLALKVEGATAHYRVDGVRVAADVAADLHESFGWLSARLIVDREALLAQRVEPAWGRKSAPEAELAPF